ncbi:hypothetical protein RFM23_30190 [Mesorhizobium abyssinicae]|uniref:Transposase n=1 Tax=Mesorhizobium abyssinicae TaxID=1209958 RepID=A0ABU5AXE3_9HYPH|nr:hypothetical protein [Mesorhizobium abyssinicae]MDX8541881.1 hypothetical protein [Mesorhizobium abyssinicae]
MKYLAMEQPSRVEASTPSALSLPTDAGRQRTRRSWTVEQKLAIVGEQAQERRLGGRFEPPPIAFIDMGVVGHSVRDVEAEEPAPARSHSEVSATSQAVSAGGRIEIVGANGRRVIVDRTVDVSVLMRILQGLEMLR